MQFLKKAKYFYDKTKIIKTLGRPKERCISRAD